MIGSILKPAIETGEAIGATRLQPSSPSSIARGFNSGVSIAKSRNKEPQNVAGRVYPVRSCLCNPDLSGRKRAGIEGAGGDALVRWAHLMGVLPFKLRMTGGGIKGGYAHPCT